MKLFRTLLLAAGVALLPSCASQKQAFSYMPRFQSSRTAEFEPVGGPIKQNFMIRRLDPGSGLLEYSDFRTGKILSVQLDSLADMGTAAIRERPYGKTGPDLTIAPTRFGRLVSVEDFGEDRRPAIILTGRKGRERARTEGYHFLSGDSEKSRSNFTGSCKVSPDGRRFAVVYGLGGIMEIYSVRPRTG